MKGVRGTAIGTLEMLQSRLYQTAKAKTECSLVKHLGELDEGKPHVQFDVEGTGEILSFTLPKTLAFLLRGDLVAESYVPTRKNRERRTLIRHRASLMKMRTEVKNRIHALLDKHDLTHSYSDLFGKEGVEWLRSLNLPSIDQQILQSNLQVLETLNEHVRNADIQIAKDAVNENQAKLLMTMPGAPRKRSCAISNKRAGVPQHTLGEPYRHAGRQCVSEARAEMRIRAQPHRDPRPLACPFNGSNQGYEEKPLFEAPEVMTLCQMVGMERVPV
jgi:hypothetical protein